MNEEQLKQIAILAKELGFKASVFPTAWLSQSLIDNIKGVDVEHVASYLLLCEIHLWLMEKQNLILEITTNNSKFNVCSGWFDHYWLYDKTNGSPKEFDTYPQALTSGILEGLKLIKNDVETAYRIVENASIKDLNTESYLKAFDTIVKVNKNESNGQSTVN